LKAGNSYKMGSKANGDDDPAAMRALIARMEAELSEKTSEAATYEAEIRSLQRKLAKREAEIHRQERELHKLRV